MSESTVADAEAYFEERRCVTKSGRVVIMSLTVSALKGEYGQPQYYVGVAQDITEQKAVIEERERNTKHLQDILDATTDGIWEWDLVTDTLVFSPRFYTMLGYRPGAFAASFQVWLDYIHPDDRSYARDVFRAWMSSKKDTGQYSFRMCARNGEYRLIEAKARVVEHDVMGKPVSVIGNLSDITERRQAEQELAQAHDRLSFQIENSPLAVIEWEKGKYIKTWSKQAELMFGWKEGEVLGKTWSDFEFIYPEDMEAAYKKITRLFDGRDLFNTVENRNYRNDRSVVYCQWYNFSLRNAKGEMVSILSQVADVTNLKQYEEDLLIAKEQAEAASRAKSGFLANMSHEIRTPLNGVLGMLQLLHTTHVDKEQSEYILTAIHSAKRLTRLLSDILDISRIEANRVSIQSERFDLIQTIKNTCELFDASFKQAGVGFSCTIDAATPREVTGDSMRMVQVLNNLLGNAFKFTKAGEVHVEVCTLPYKDPDKVNVYFSVADTGIGIPDEKIGMLFKPFSQVGEGFQRDYQGAGLGLAICKQLIELMDGSIAIASEEGAGTSIHFTIPFERVAPKAETAGTSRTEGEHHAAALKLLLAEDDMVNRVAVQKLLESCGHRVETALNGKEALDKLEQQDFDIVLMDVQMPVLDGIATTKAIRKGSVGRGKAKIPIIALTAYAMPGDEKRFLDVGMDGYLAKPVNLEDFNRVFINVLEAK